MTLSSGYYLKGNMTPRASGDLTSASARTSLLFTRDEQLVSQLTTYGFDVTCSYRGLLR